MNAKLDDAGSLSRLHDIVAAPPAPWWPPTPAWFVLGFLVLLGVGCATAWLILRRCANWYRRAALAELRMLELSRTPGSAALPKLAELLKRVALVAFSRGQVASLTGEAWLQFLDRTANTSDFTRGPGKQLLEVYDQRALPPSTELVEVARRWIRQHRGDQRC